MLFIQEQCKNWNKNSIKENFFLFKLLKILEKQQQQTSVNKRKFFKINNSTKK